MPDLSPLTKDQFNFRLQNELGLTNEKETLRKIALCMIGWVLVVDERDGRKRIAIYPPEVSARVLHPNYGQD